MSVNNLMLVNLSISAWTARKYDKKVSDQVATDHGATGNVGRYNKNLLPFEAASYKEDFSIHIGGNDLEEVIEEFELALEEELKRFEPEPFAAHCYYDECAKYAWPDDVCCECGQKLPGKDVNNDA